MKTSKGDMSTREEIIRLFPEQVKETFARAINMVSSLQKIRLRCNQPVIFRSNGTDYYMTDNGNIVGELQSPYIIYKTGRKHIYAYVQVFCLRL